MLTHTQNFTFTMGMAFGHRGPFPGDLICITLTFPDGSDVKNLPTMRETWVQFLGWEDPLEKRMAIHSSILAWRIPWTEEPSGLQSTGSQRVRHNWAPNTSLHFIVEKKMATHSSLLAWRTPGMGEPGGLPSMGSHRVGHNWSDLAAAATALYRQ